MLISTDKIPERYACAKSSRRQKAVEEFLRSGYRCAEYRIEETDTPRRAYNGILMAVRRRYSGQVSVCWRSGRVFLIRRS